MAWTPAFQSALLVSAVYAGLSLVFAFGIFRLRRSRGGAGRPRVSIVIAARNEEGNIGDCIRAAAAQDYPSELYEIIVVNDRSTDGTASAIRRAGEGIANLRTIDVASPPAGYSPKKHALGTGIAAARGEVILTTDADCRPGRGWVAGMASRFGEDTGLAAGYSPLRPKNGRRGLLHAFAAFDSLALASMAAGSIGAGWATTCSGRNLAFRKSAFDEIGGYSGMASYVSGDDDLLLHAIRTRTRWKIAYAADPRAAVPSLIHLDWRSFFNQRIRHASKFKAYPVDIKLFGIFMYIANIGFLLSVAGIAAVPSAAGSAWLAAVLKAGADLLTVACGMLAFGQRLPLAYLPAVIVLHPLYVAVFGILGLRGKFIWKGETHHSEMHQC